MSMPGEMQSHEGLPRALMREAMRGVAPEAMLRGVTRGNSRIWQTRASFRDFPVIRELLAEDALSVQLGYLDGPALASHVNRWRSALASAPNAVLANRIVDLCDSSFSSIHTASGPTALGRR